MQINKALVEHYKCQTIPIYDLSHMVLLSTSYLKEKPTWYQVNGVLNYFKVRSDYRLFTELFFGIFGREVLEMDTLEYRLASVRATDPDNPYGGAPKLGLLSENFQDKSSYNYYLVSELMDSKVLGLNGCDYSLTGLLKFFKHFLDDESYVICKDFLIKLFIADAFTMQLDRNPNNIGFEVPKIDDVKYTSRLRGLHLKKHGYDQHYVLDKHNYPKITNFRPSKVYDNERIFGVDHRNVFSYKPGDVWTPVWPYSSDFLFQTQDDAIGTQEFFSDGMDPNLASLIIEYPECANIIDRLANGDEYRGILEKFKNQNSPVILSREDLDYFEGLLSDRRNAFKNVLQLK